MTADQPITYVDVDPLIPTHLGTDAPHVHHRGSDRCLRNVDGPECLSGVELRVRVAELEAENERLGRLAARKVDVAPFMCESHLCGRCGGCLARGVRDHVTESARALRAAQQRLDAVQALPERWQFTVEYVLGQHRTPGTTAARMFAEDCIRDLRAALGVSPVPSQPAPETQPTNEALIEAVSAEVHAAWMETKRQQGVTSRPSEWGEEQMVPYADLTERAKDLDRGTVKAVLAALGRVAPRQQDEPARAEEEQA